MVTVSIIAEATATPPLTDQTVSFSLQGGLQTSNSAVIFLAFGARLRVLRYPDLWGDQQPGTQPSSMQRPPVGSLSLNHVNQSNASPFIIHMHSISPVPLESPA